MIAADWEHVTAEGRLLYYRLPVSPRGRGREWITLDKVSGTWRWQWFCLRDGARDATLIVSRHGDTSRERAMREAEAAVRGPTTIRRLLHRIAAAHPDLAHVDGWPNLTRIAATVGCNRRTLRRAANDSGYRTSRVLVAALRGLTKEDAE